MIKVSVIVTTFNSEKSVAHALNSVFAQAGAGKEFTLEVIAVDDCSSDSTLEILKKFNVTIYSTGSNSGGPNKGRNIGLRKATGECICFLDHDDCWAADKIRLQLKAAELAPIVTCGYDTIDHSRNNKVSVSRRTEFKIFKENETFLRKLAREKHRQQTTYLSTMMIHQKLKHVLFEEHFGMVDYDWLLRIFENQCSAEVPCNLVTRFVDGRNLSLNKEYRKKDYYYSLMCLESFEKKYPVEVMTAHKRINGSRARYYYLTGDMQEARRYLRKAMPGVKELLYYITSFYGSEWVKKKFTVFG